jgi:hypothetical protein
VHDSDPEKAGAGKAQQVKRQAGMYPPDYHWNNATTKGSKKYNY